MTADASFPNPPSSIDEPHGCDRRPGGFHPDSCYLCVQSLHCFREERGEDAYEQARTATLADWDQLEAENREARTSAGEQF